MGSEERYRLGDLIGQGGIGRVVEATDLRLARGVAIKLVLDGAPEGLADRFAREARLTAQLDHPNIVPIYDFGELGDDRRLFLCMKRIRGADLGLLLRAIALGDAKARDTYTRARLLAIFQDIGHGIAFAHSRGVIHRDLKPSNVMIGDFGETLIVDWGLAKQIGEAEAPRAGAADGDDGSITIDGEVIGTPAYMAPEQVEGRTADVGPWTDIYALGAVLYEILTLKPPFEGDTVFDILADVSAGRFVPPSERAPGIPAELESICLRAMARRRDARYPSAAEMVRDVQLFLEGVRERERIEREAAARVVEGRDALARYAALQDEIDAQARVVRELSERLKPHQPVEEKRPLWEAEAAVRRLEEDRIECFARANAAFGQALTLDAAHAEALGGKCELYLARYLEAEARRDRNEMLLQRRTLAHYDVGGAYRGRLDAPGRLVVRAYAYACDCLSPRPTRVEFGDEPVLPWRDGRARPDLELTDADRPAPTVSARFGHGPGCPRRPIDVRVTIAPYEEREKRLVAGAAREFGGEPMARGSYLCILTPPAPYSPVRLPVRIERGETWEQEVNVYDVPDGFAYVPGGPFTFGGVGAGGGEAEARVTEDFFIARFAVTCRDYLEFLNELPIEEARRRQPREGDRKWWLEDRGRFRLPEASVRARMVWQEDWPVFSINWFDALAYCAWRSARDGRLYTPPHEEEFEKAARGVDGRVYPYGDHYDGTFSHTNVSQPGRMRARPVGTFPADESPYGARDLAGCVATWCLNAPEVPYRAYCCLRGGAWSNTSLVARSAFRQGNLPPTRLSWDSGVRLVYRAHA